MIVIQAVNVNDAYDKAVDVMHTHGVKQTSRNGGVTVAPCPVTTVYMFPTQRVLLNEKRDANPFFHLFESLWMLSGSNDATWLDRFVSDFSSRYAEKDGNQWGAYGHRWRRHFGFDQLDAVVNRLKKDPNDRRVVIQMWEAGMDLYDPEELDDETGKPFPEPRDVPCNTQIYPRIVGGRLDITVTCRSNDVVWGAYGANAVHFSVLQEYLAGRIGVYIGHMYQISNNWHLYDAVENRFKIGTAREYPGVMPMGTNWDEWDDDLYAFLDNPNGSGFKNEWFSLVAAPMWQTHEIWKAGDKIGAQIWADSIGAADWRMAVDQWMDRRISK